MNNASERLHQSLEQGRELDAARQRIAELEALKEASESRVSTERLNKIVSYGDVDQERWQLAKLALEYLDDLQDARKRIAELEGQLATAKMVGRKGAFEDVCQSLKTFPHNVHDSDVYNGIKDLLATARQLGAVEALEQAQEQEQFTGYDIAVWLDNRITELRKELECPATT